MKYILASGSPRRRELLARTGINFEVIPSDMDEVITKDVPSDIVMELAYQKALNVYNKLNITDCTVIGSDTIVVYRGEILGKPADKAEAFDMLSMLADRTHQVYTGVSLLVNIGGKLTTKTFYEKTDVTLYPISKEDLHAYVNSGDPLDKAGAYGIQGDFAIHIKGINGDYNNVVGLPIGRLYQKLKSIKI
jgi:septum formation protein